jgi:hypothetical protein
MLRPDIRSLVKLKNNIILPEKVVRCLDIESDKKTKSGQPH